jgi:diguanylate cyclase (GGDEF)-like protein
MPEAAVSVPEAAAPGLSAAETLAAATPAEPTERPAAATAAAAFEADSGRRFAYDQERAHDPRAERAIESFLGLAPGRAPTEGPSPDPYLDPLTGLDTLLAWERDLAEEDARYARYRRPVTVVVAELDGLARLVERFGEEPARRILPAVGDTMRRYARRTDRVAHAGGGRFLVLMPETDEIQAINYVERVRAASERWLEAGAVSLHLSIGWASPTAVGQLDTALRAAEERMLADRRRTRRPEADPAR